MKRTSILLPVLLCTGALAGCGQKSEDSTNASAEYPVASPTADAVEAMPDASENNAATTANDTSADAAAAAADSVADAAAKPNDARGNEGHSGPDE
jgi:hypothetical protein